MSSGSRRTENDADGWYHWSVRCACLRIGADEWCLSMRPELRITIDGVSLPKSDIIGGKVTRKKSRRSTTIY